jgi:hypothetical protein
MGIFADAFQDMMPATVTVQSMVGRADDGTPVYSSPNTYQARVSFKTRNTIGKDGQTVVARGRAWLDTVDRITVNDLITLDDGSNPIVLNVSQIADETGPAYTALDFQ